MTQLMDCKGLKCPQPVLQVAIAYMAKKIPSGTLLEVQADCCEFPSDVQKWCQRQELVLVSCVETGDGAFSAQIQF